MRQLYRITINEDDREDLKKVLDVLGRPLRMMWRGPDWYDYQVDLSKYELLYLRLSCNVGKIKAVDKTAEIA